MTRDTTTGEKFEKATARALTRRGIPFESQVEVGQKPGGGKHRVDHLVMRPNGTQLLVSCKAQNVSGTAEEKIPYEIIKLAHCVMQDRKRFGPYAVIVLDGSGWSQGMREMLKGEVWNWMARARQYVRIYDSAEEFIKHEFPPKH